MGNLHNKSILDTAASTAELKKPLKEIFQAWPNLYKITLNLVDFMGLVLPSDKGMPLLMVCVTNAVKEFRNVTPVQYGTEAQMVAYIRGLLSDVDQIIKVSLGNLNDDPDVWEPMVDDLEEFQIKNEGKVKIYYTPYADVKSSSIRLMILSRIITTKDLFWIDQYASLSSLLQQEGA